MRRGEDWRCLRTDFERRRAGAHWLGLIFACGGADEIYVNGWRYVGAAIVEGVGVDVDVDVDGVAVVAAAAVGGGGDDDAGVDDVSGVGADGVTLIGRIGVEAGAASTLLLLLSLSLSRRDQRGSE